MIKQEYPCQNSNYNDEEAMVVDIDDLISDSLSSSSSSDNSNNSSQNSQPGSSYHNNHNSGKNNAYYSSGQKYQPGQRGRPPKKLQKPKSYNNQESSYLSNALSYSQVCVKNEPNSDEDQEMKDVSNQKERTVKPKIKQQDSEDDSMDSNNDDRSNDPALTRYDNTSSTNRDDTFQNNSSSQDYSSETHSQQQNGSHPGGVLGQSNNPYVNMPHQQLLNPQNENPSGRMSFFRKKKRKNYYEEYAHAHQSQLNLKPEWCVDFSHFPMDALTMDEALEKYNELGLALKIQFKKGNTRKSESGFTLMFSLRCFKGAGMSKKPINQGITLKTQQLTDCPVLVKFKWVQDRMSYLRS
eukprot:403333150